MTTRTFHSILFSLCCMATAYARQEAPKVPSPKADEMAGTVKQLTREQDELQADLSEIIADQTQEEVIKLFEQCRAAMNDSIDLFEQQDTSAKNLAAQSDVIERIYQAAKAKYSDGNGNCKPGAEGIMSMLRRMLGMEGPPSQSPGENSDSSNSPPSADQPSQGGNQPGISGGNDEGAFESGGPRKGQSDPNALKEERTVPKSSGVGPAEMPEEFRSLLESYNKTLQQ